MGDVRFLAPYERLRGAPDRSKALREIGDADLVAALAAASLERDAYLANVLATETQNRLHLKDTVLRVAGEGLGALDRTGGLIFLNPAGERILGHPPGALLAKNFHDAVHNREPDGTPLPRERCEVLRAVLGEGRPWHSEDQVFSRADGTLFPVSYTATPVLRDGQIDGAVFVFQDLTERVRAQRELEDSKERYRSLMQHHVDAVFAFDTEGRFLEANPALGEMSGYSLEEVHRITFEPLVDPPDLARTREHFMRAVRGEAQSYQTTMRCKDGSRKRVHVTNIPIYVDGRVVGVYGIAREVTAGGRAGP